MCWFSCVLDVFQLCFKIGINGYAQCLSLKLSLSLCGKLKVLCVTLPQISTQDFLLCDKVDTSCRVVVAAQRRTNSLTALLNVNLGTKSIQEPCSIARAFKSMGSCRGGLLCLFMYLCLWEQKRKRYKDVKCSAKQFRLHLGMFRYIVMRF